jgi:hypothetical protein
MKDTLLEILEKIDSESTEHIKMDGLRFTGVSIEKINQVFKQYGVEIEIPF